MSVSDLDRLSPEGNAVFTWFSKLPFFERSALQITLDGVSDGILFWEALQELNSEFFSGDLPEGAQSAGRWVNNLQNLKRVYKLLRQYLMETSKTALPNGPGEIDIKAIAEGSDDEEIVTMLKWILVAASNSPGNDEFVHVMLAMSPENQAHMMNIITSFNVNPEHEPDDGSAIPDEPLASPAKGPAESELYNEEMYGKLASDNRRLEMEKRDLQREARNLDNRNNRLVENLAAIREELRMAQDKAEQASIDQDGQARIKLLEAKIQNLEDHIGDQESRLGEALAEQSALTTENGKLRNANEKLQPLQDAFDETKRERDQLARRVNLLDKYRSKVEEQSHIQQENEDLRRELDEIKAERPDATGDDFRARNIALERQAIELQTLVSSSEMQLMDAQTRRKAIEDLNEELREEIEELRKKHQADLEQITNLEAQADTVVSGAVGLDKELQDSEKADADTEEDSELKANNERLTKASSRSAAQYQALQQLFDEQKEKYADLEKRYFETYKERLALENSGSKEELETPDKYSKHSANAFNRTEFFKETKGKLEAKELELSELQRETDAFRHKMTEQEKTSMLDDLMKMTGDDANDDLVALVDKDKLEALERLKEINSEELRGQEVKIVALDGKVKRLTTELDEHRKMLSETLTAKHQHNYGELSEEKRRELDEARQKELRDLLEQTSQERELVLKKDQKIQDREQEISDLKALLQQERDRAAPTLLKASAQAALKQELDNIKRENKLMSTAYFDLSSRLQMNNVSLQRRAEAPRSFLNKQRALVNQATAVRMR